MAGNRLGFWSSVLLLGIGVGYLLALAAGFARYGLREPISDPLLAVMEALTLVAAPAIVTLMAAVHDRARPEHKVYALTALAFGTLCAGTTGVIHFVELTAVRQLGESGLVWPSPAYAAELLAWDIFLGLALLFASAVFVGAAERMVRRGLVACGALCLAGAIGPAVGSMRLQLVGVFGYAAVLPVVSFSLARLFAADARASRRNS